MKSFELDDQDVAKLENELVCLHDAIEVIRVENHFQRVFFWAYYHEFSNEEVPSTSGARYASPEIRHIPSPLSLPPHLCNLYVLRDSIARFRRSWSKQWCVLDLQSFTVRLYKRSYWRSFRGDLNLNLATKIKMMGQRGFRIEFGSGNMLLMRSKHEREATRWVQLLRFAMQWAQGNAIMVDSGDLWRDRNKLFVSGLPLYVDDNALYEKFKSFGEMHQSKVVYDKIVWPSLLPAGVSVHSAKFNVTGNEKFTARMADKNLGNTKVTLSFELDSNGIAQIAKAEETLEEEVDVKVIVKKEKLVKKAKGNSDDGIEDDSTEAGEKDQSEIEEKPEVRLEKQTKTHREKLMVVRAYETHKSEQEMSVLPMSETLKKASMRMLKEMERADNKRRADLEAKNSLETFNYKAHDTLSSQESEIMLVTIPEQVESLQSNLDETESWLYDMATK
ncbi:hypothetical protein PsorP6_005351 [Peronosclerospora sorghi]|uniref:Uncharacterized protein n=1 Tax=Peronosclerospora sorghi TaxID=230839 RepID=A0ACC0W2J0_9STRA|nr:hypothetical protein PsorP6_005351 [Peronosclerospora sorghi]